MTGVQKTLTDCSGYFYEGQTLNEVKESDNKLISLFINHKKEFARIDSDNDGILSHEEMSAKLKRDYKGSKFTTITGGIITALNLINMRLARSKSAAFFAGALLVNTIYSYCATKDAKSKLAEA